ncbi:MAG: hypothetical protein MJ224_07175 [archaeon]|nr:hypothetical protein [archaeon]
MAKQEMIKLVKGLNEDYLKEHADDIINNTNALLCPFSIDYIRFSQDPELEIIYYLINEKHKNNFQLFGRGNYFMKPGETREEAFARVDLEYCEATGHWDLFKWEEVPKAPFIEECKRIDKEDPYLY